MSGSGATDESGCRLLVENAIRHGIGTHKEADAVSIGAYSCDDRLHLEVRNLTSVLDDDPERLLNRGVGLANTRARLEQLYGKQQSFEIRGFQSRGVVASMSIPRRALAAPDLRLVGDTRPDEYLDSGGRRLAAGTAKCPPASEGASGNRSNWRVRRRAIGSQRNIGGETRLDLSRRPDAGDGWLPSGGSDRRGTDARNHFCDGIRSIRFAGIRCERHRLPAKAIRKESIRKGSHAGVRAKCREPGSRGGPADSPCHHRERFQAVA